MVEVDEELPKCGSGEPPEKKPEKDSATGKAMLHEQQAVYENWPTGAGQVPAESLLPRRGELRSERSFAHRYETGSNPSAAISEDGRTF